MASRASSTRGAHVDGAAGSRQGEGATRGIPAGRAALPGDVEVRIGYYVQGAMDEAVVRGFARRWCPHAGLAGGRFRGSSGESFRREIRKSLMELKDDKECDFLVVLTDADANRWRDVRQKEWDRIPQSCQHLTLLGVADRNIECWLAIDRSALATSWRAASMTSPWMTHQVSSSEGSGSPTENGCAKDRNEFVISW